MPSPRLDESGDLVLPCEWLSGLAAVAQRLRLRLLRWKGEDRLDVDAGLDYRRWGSSRTPPLREIESAFRREVMADPAVVSVEGVRTVFDRVSRTVTISLTIRAAEDGEEGFVGVSASPSPRYSGSVPIWNVSAHRIAA